MEGASAPKKAASLWRSQTFSDPFFPSNRSTTALANTAGVYSLTSTTTRDAPTQQWSAASARPRRSDRVDEENAETPFSSSHPSFRSTRDGKLDSAISTSLGLRGRSRENLDANLARARSASMDRRPSLEDSRFGHRPRMMAACEGGFLPSSDVMASLPSEESNSSMSEGQSQEPADGESVEEDYDDAQSAAEVEMEGAPAYESYEEYYSQPLRTGVTLRSILLPMFYPLDTPVDVTADRGATYREDRVAERGTISTAPKASYSMFEPVLDEASGKPAVEAWRANQAARWVEQEDLRMRKVLENAKAVRRHKLVAEVLAAPKSCSISASASSNEECEKSASKEQDGLEFYASIMEMCESESEAES